MSRSRRETPIAGFSFADPEKQEKRQANRRIRHSVRRVLRTEPSTEVLPHNRELSNEWTMSKDGKRWFDAAQDPKSMRK